ncbi:MgtC/SapB family protein [Neoroseomonas soli]|uniref:Protein MgtC n=1 Tax=Neoroseomonas soli TaxID=1081025 RepID=A0A9X9WWN4_9PROT|nr:MgtC/SapB family protein [Neoroseomonas soli]MBR0671563.1 MgtC/SapB family protein [Neoroseomonas soli]
MRFLTTIQALPILDSMLSLLAAFGLGTLVGMERQFRQRSAGLRTNTLVAVGAAAFVDIGQRLAGDAEAVRVISYVVSGIGFLGAGVIMKEGMNVRGLNTAATLWCSAAIGAAAGSDLLVEAVLITVFVLAGNTMLRPVVTWIERLPLDRVAVEARIEVRATTTPAQLPAVRRHLIDRLRAAQYPVSDIEVAERGEEAVEVTAVLVSTAVVVAELEAVVAQLARHPGVTDAAWESSALE